MCIYCGTKNYRKIYEHHHGVIQRDEMGRSYHVHHIDGKRSNNSPENLVALSIQEHYDLHYAQGDWAASMKLAATIGMTHEVLSELARKQGIAAYKNGRHPFVNINESRQDITIHQWKNKNTGEKIDSTITDLARRCGQKAGPFTRVINGDIQSFKGWMRLDKIYDRTTTHPRYDPTKYKWVNENTEQTLDATISELAKICESPSSYLSAVTGGRRKNHKGWSLLKQPDSE